MKRVVLILALALLGISCAGSGRTQAAAPPADQILINEQAQLSLTRFIRSGSTNIIASFLRFKSTINRLARVGEFDRSSRGPSI